MQRIIRGSALGVGAVGLVLGLAAGPASASTATHAAATASARTVPTPDGPGSAVGYTVCHPSLTGEALPYTATTGSPPPSCDNSFAWGFTVSGSSSGQARWDSPLVGSGWTCTAEAWIPDSHSDDPNAQYYTFDGSHYLANDAFVNQEQTTNGWVNIANNTWFPINDHMVVTLSDHNPLGQAGWYEAAYAVQFLCH